ncbi:MAG: nucleotidyltransferase family protein [Gammaproteobacteria bacterium]|nr:nucleotidyltransferase family protein [Gammaproteobacteria bacterium]
MEPENGAAVVLAAGTSERFGADKRVANVDGLPMLVRSIQPYLAERLPVYVTLRPADPVRSALPHEVHVIEAPDAQFGMGHSLAAAAEKLSNVSWLLIGLADMPWISQETIAQIVEGVSTCDDAIVRPSYRGQSGHPVGFTSSFLDELKRLTGDIGAKDVIKRNHDKVVDLPVTDEAILRDVDTPRQLRA